LQGGIGGYKGMNPEEEKNIPQSAPKASASAESASSKEEASRTFLDEFLNLISRGKVRVSLYPEKHPLSQEMLSEFQNFLKAALASRSEIILDCQPGRIVLNEEFTIGDKPNVLQFSKEMYQRRVARIHFDGTASDAGIYNFLRFLGAEAEALQRQSKASGEPAASWDGIRIDFVDYQRLSRVRGESLAGGDVGEKKISLLEYLLGAAPESEPALENLTKHIPLSEKFINSLKAVPDISDIIIDISDDAAPERHVGILFRNLVGIVSGVTGENAEDMKRELIRHFLGLPANIRADILLDIYPDDAERGRVLDVLERVTPSQQEEIIASLKTEASREDTSDSAVNVLPIIRAIYGEIFKEQERDIWTWQPKPLPPDEKCAAALRNALSPVAVTSRYKRYASRIFIQSNDPYFIMRRVDALSDDISLFLDMNDWKGARNYIEALQKAFKEKKFPDADSGIKIYKALERKVVALFKPTLLQCLSENPVVSLSDVEPILGLFDLKLQHIYMEALAEVPDRSLRKKIIDFVAKGHELPETALQQMMGHEQWYVVRNAVTLMREVPAEEWLPHLEKMLEHEELRIRKESVLALGRIKAPKALDLLLKTYQNKAQDESLRAMALEVMSAFDDERVDEILRAHLNDTRNPSVDFAMRAAGIAQMKKFKDNQTVQELLAFIKKPHLLNRKGWNELKLAAVKALEEIGTLQAKAALLQAEKYLPREE